MPHRVTSFFRSSTSSLENQVSNFAKKTSINTSRRRDSPSRSGRTSGSGERVVYASSTEDDGDETQAPPYARLKMGESRTSSFSSDSHREHGHHHRISFPGMHFGRSNKESHSNSLATLDWKLESPPIVLYGDADHSTGALVSGQLFLDIKEDGVEIQSLDATLSIRVSQKKPFANHCTECASQTTELKKWQLLPNPLALKRGNSPLSPQALASDLRDH